MEIGEAFVHRSNQIKGLSETSIIEEITEEHQDGISKKFPLTADLQEALI